MMAATNSPPTSTLWYPNHRPGWKSWARRLDTTTGQHWALRQRGLQSQTGAPKNPKIAKNINSGGLLYSTIQYYTEFTTPILTKLNYTGRNYIEIWTLTIVNLEPTKISTRYFFKKKKCTVRLKIKNTSSLIVTMMTLVSLLLPLLVEEMVVS